MHTSPLSDPGEGDAGGMNVYVRQLSRAMVGEGAAVHVVTRSDTGEAWEARDEGVAVAGLPVGPPDAAKEDLPALVPDFARAGMGVQVFDQVLADPTLVTISPRAREAGSA